MAAVRRWRSPGSRVPRWPRQKTSWWMSIRVVISSPGSSAAGLQWSTPFRQRRKTMWRSGWPSCPEDVACAVAAMFKSLLTRHCIQGNTKHKTGQDITCETHKIRFADKQETDHNDYWQDNGKDPCENVMATEKSDHGDTPFQPLTNELTRHYLLKQMSLT